MKDSVQVNGALLAHPSAALIDIHAISRNSIFANGLLHAAVVPGRYLLLAERGHVKL